MRRASSSSSDGFKISGDRSYSNACRVGLQATFPSKISMLEPRTLCKAGHAAGPCPVMPWPCRRALHLAEKCVTMHICHLSVKRSSSSAAHLVVQRVVQQVHALLVHDEGRRVVRRLVGRLWHVVHGRVVAANRRVGAGTLHGLHKTGCRVERETEGWCGCRQWSSTCWHLAPVAEERCKVKGEV